MFSAVIILSVICTSITSAPLGTASGSLDTAILTPFNTLSEITNKKIEQTFRSKVIYFSPPFPDSGRKQAVLEQETLLSKPVTAYGRLQEFVASFYHPKPVVDTLKEHEKYGNDGAKSRAASTIVVGGIEAASNLANAAINAPFETARQFGKKVTLSLNTLGGKIVGLAY